MTNFKFLSSAFALLGLFFFTACQKEALQSPQPETTPPTILALSSNCYPIYAFGYMPSCDGTDFTLCNTDFPYNPTVDPQYNHATGTVYVDELEDLVIDLSNINLSPEIQEDIAANQNFRVTEDMVLPQEMVSAVYQNADLEAPTNEFLMASGDYPVELEGDVAMATPRKIIYKYRRNGTLKKIIVKY